MGQIEMPGGYNPPQAPSQNNQRGFNLSNIVVGNGFNFSNVVVGNNAFMVNDSDNSPDSPDSPDTPDNDYGSSSFVMGGGSNIIMGGLSIISGNGYVNITQNGVTTSYRGNSASMNNNRVFVDGRAVGPADAVINPHLNQNNYVNAQGSNSSYSHVMNMLGGMQGRPVAAASAPNPVNNHPACSVDPAPVRPGAQDMNNDEFISQCSKPVREYINSSQLNKRIGERISELKLTNEEEALFEKFVDPITQEYINIPVDINEVYYDISTVLKWKFKDPQSREPYESSDVRSGRRLVNDLDQAIETLRSKRGAAQPQASAVVNAESANVVMAGAGAPVGPGFSNR
jgi:hypothetical protein